MTSVAVQVDRWAAWLEGDPAPAVAFLPASQRRRLSPLARVAFDTIWRVVEPEVHLPVVFASRYGEIVSSWNMLSALARDELLSPTAFSHSVHNAIAGQASIARRDESEAVALAAGRDTLAMAFTEAAGLLAEGAGQVLVVACDERLPEAWQPLAPLAEPAYALAALMVGAGGTGLSLTTEAKGEGAEPHAARAVVQLLKGEVAAVRTSGELGDWLWRRRG